MEKPAADHVGSPAPLQQERPANGPAGPECTASGKPLTDAARRALAEAAERRMEVDLRAAALASRPELDGRGGLEPVRYDDWEIAGRAVDF